MSKGILYLIVIIILFLCLTLIFIYNAIENDYPWWLGIIQAILVPAIGLPFSLGIEKLIEKIAKKE